MIDNIRPDGRREVEPSPGSALRTFVALSALATAVCNTDPAAAQEAPARENGLAASVELSEIVVTATRRSESINKVPESIVALDQEALDNQGIRNFADIVSQTPGLSLLPTSTFQPQNIAIRGIRSVVGAATTGIYIDDTPVQMRNITPQDPGDTLPNIFDLGRVEVLRGPQGTLFGAGSEGGAVRFISPTPSLAKTDFYSRSEVAGTQGGGLSYEAGVAAGTPIIEGKLGVRMSASYDQVGGYIDRINQVSGALSDRNVNSSTVQTTKVALLYVPTESLRITPSFNYQETNNNDSAQYYVGLSNPSQNRFISGAVVPQPTWDRFYLPALKIEGDLGAVTVTAVTSYFSRSQSGVQDFSIVDNGVISLFNSLSPSPDPNLPTLPIKSPLPAAYVADGGGATFYSNYQGNFTQELRVQSNNESAPLRWLIGEFYQRNLQTNIQHTDDAYYAAAFETLLGAANVNGIENYALDFASKDEQIAGFADVDYRIGEFTLTAGGRIASTKYSFSQALAGALNGYPHTNVGEQKESPFTPKFSATWEPNDNALLYLSAAKGFREGGANAPVPVSPPCTASLAALGLAGTPATYQSDSLWNYEAGTKLSLFDRTFHVNASLYHIDWSNIQNLVALNGCPIGYVANLGSANSDGFDLEVSARPTGSLLLSVSAGYNRSIYEKTVIGGGVVLAQKDSIISDAPPWQVTTTIEYSTPVSGGEAYARGIDEFSSRNTGLYSKYDNPAAAGYDPDGQRNDAYNLLNLRLGWRSAAFDVSLFVDNLTDSHPQLNHSYSALPTDTTYFANTLRPRTLGVTLISRY